VSIEPDSEQQTEIGQSKEREWSTVDDETERNACDRGSKQVDCSQQHETLVNVELATVIKRQPDQYSEYEHVADRDDQKRKRFGSRATANSSVKAGQNSDDNYECSQHAAEYSETLMNTRSPGCDQRYLHDKEHDPCGHDDAVQVNDASGEIGCMEER